MDLSEFDVKLAKALTRRRIEQADRRRDFMQWTDAQRDEEVAAAWADLEAAHPNTPREDAIPEPKSLERQQIEKIGFWIWDMFHARHGGEFDPSATDSPAIKMTMAVADRTWAIAQQRASRDNNEVARVFDYLNKLARAEDWMWIDNLLEGLDLTVLSDDEMVAYARCSWPMRDRLEVYGEFLVRCRAAITRRGGDLALLHGLEAAPKSTNTATPDVES